MEEDLLAVVAADPASGRLTSPSATLRSAALRGGDLNVTRADLHQQVRAGTMTPAAARQHPWRNVVTRALSGGDDPEIDVVELGFKGFVERNQPIWL